MANKSTKRIVQEELDKKVKEDQLTAVRETGEQGKLKIDSERRMRNEKRNNSDPRGILDGSNN